LYLWMRSHNLPTPDSEEDVGPYRISSFFHWLAHTHGSLSSPLSGPIVWLIICSDWLVPIGFVLHSGGLLSVVEVGIELLVESRWKKFRRCRQKAGWSWEWPPIDDKHSNLATGANKSRSPSVSYPARTDMCYS
jgi:hypothetical protein